MKRSFAPLRAVSVSGRNRRGAALAVIVAVVVAGVTIVLGVRQTGDERLGHFNADNLQVPRDQLLSGGPPKDGIPALTEPPAVPASEAGLEREDRVAGVTVNGASRAYPIRVLNWHEIVNDTLGGVPIAVVYCPLCDSLSVVDRRIDGRIIEFGVSGLLLNSNVVLYNRADDSLWSQVGLTAISGPHAGKSLDHLPFEISGFADWKGRHPDGSVMGLMTGHDRQYGRNPYAGYLTSPDLMFPVEHKDDRLPLKERVIGVRVGETAKAYPLATIADAPDQTLTDRIEGQEVTLRYDPARGAVRVENPPEEAQVVHTFWFAWAAFHPKTRLHASEAPATQPADHRH